MPMKKTSTFNYCLHSLTSRKKNTELSSNHPVYFWEDTYPEIVAYLDAIEQDVDDGIIENILNYAKEYVQTK